MKKKTDQKLSLGKIKIASLSKASQHAIRGGSYGCITLTTCPPPQSNKFPICTAPPNTQICKNHF